MSNEKMRRLKTWASALLWGLWALNYLRVSALRQISYLLHTDR